MAVTDAAGPSNCVTSDRRELRALGIKQTNTVYPSRLGAGGAVACEPDCTNAIVAEQTSRQHKILQESSECQHRSLPVNAQRAHLHAESGNQRNQTATPYAAGGKGRTASSRRGERRRPRWHGEVYGVGCVGTGRSSGFADRLRYLPRRRHPDRLATEDRLGRNMRAIVNTLHALTERGVTVRSLHDGVDTSTSTGRMVAGVLISLAEYERELVRQRTASSSSTPESRGPSSAAPPSSTPTRPRWPGG
jgi:hypothetical protein